MGALLLGLAGVVPCTIVRRVNRFVVEILVSGRGARAYINNTGRLSEYLVEGRKGFCLRSSGTKTKYRLFAVEDMGSAALVDTRLQMSAFEKAVELSLLPWLEGCAVRRRDYRLGESVIDYMLSCPRGDFLVEVKSAVLRQGDYAMYPDCPTQRGRRHIAALTSYVRSGGRAAIVFIAALPYVRAFKPYAEGDPEILSLLREAASSGVLIKALAMHFDPALSAIVLDDPDLTVEL